MKQLCIVLISLLLTCTTLSAARALVSVYGGGAYYDETFTNATQFGTRLSFAGREGLGIDGSISLITADSKESGITDLQAVPVLLGITYEFPLKSRIRPYFGGQAGFSFLNDDYDSPKLTLGVKTGLMMSFSKDTKFFIEANQLLLKSKISGESIDINPLNFVAGFGISFGESRMRNKSRKQKIQNQNKQFNPVRKPKRNRRPRPRGPR